MDNEIEEQWAAPEWKMTGSDSALSRSKLTKVILEHTPLLNVLVDIIFDFLRRDIWELGTIPKAGMYGTFGKTATLWGQIISVQTPSYISTFTLFMRISGVLNLNAVLYEMSGTLSNDKGLLQDLAVHGQPLWRSQTYCLKNSGDLTQTFDRKKSEIRQTVPCEPNKFYLLAILYHNSNQLSSSEIGYVPYLKWHKVYRSVYASGIHENFNDLGSYALYFRTTFTSNY